MASRDQLEASWYRKRDQKKMCSFCSCRIFVGTTEPPKRRHHARLHIALLQRLQTDGVHSNQPSPRLLRPALP